MDHIGPAVGCVGSVVDRIDSVVGRIDWAGPPIVDSSQGVAPGEVGTGSAGDRGAESVG